MKYLVSIVFVSFLCSCGSNLTESEAESKLNVEMGALVAEACSCLKSVEGLTGDELLEKSSECKSRSASKLHDISVDFRIHKKYPELHEKMRQEFYKKTGQCQ